MWNRREGERLSHLPVVEQFEHVAVDWQLDILGTGEISEERAREGLKTVAKVTRWR